MVGQRIKRVQKYIGNETFMMTYGDGVCDVDISELLNFHQKKGKFATLTSVIQQQTKGAIDINYDNSVRAFREKNLKDAISINAGYMVLEPTVFNYIEDDSTVFETDVLGQLAKEGQLMSYKHNGFWQCMDTKTEKLLLEKMWKSGYAPWRKW